MGAACMRIAICGPGRAGKDASAEWLRDHTRLRYTIATSSVIVPAAAKKLGVSEEEMFRVRHQHRKLMFDTGVELREQDPAWLVREVIRRGNDIVVGVRDRPEMETVRAERLVDLSLWIDKPGVEADPTLKYGPELCDVIVPNHWGLPELHARLKALAWSWGVLRLA